MKPYRFTVEEMPGPQIEAPNDAIVQITTANICGLDAHVYEGPNRPSQACLRSREPGPRRGVTKIKVGDRVSMPFSIGCGFCFLNEKVDIYLDGYLLDRPDTQWSAGFRSNVHGGGSGSGQGPHDAG